MRDQPQAREQVRSVKHFPHPAPEGGASKREFRGVLRGIAKVCAQFGSVGPRFLLAVGRSVETTSDPDFFIVGNPVEGSRQLLIEPLPSAVTEAWVRALVSELRKHGSWQVQVSLGHGVGILVASAEILFQDSIGEIQGLADAVQKALQLAIERAQYRESARLQRLSEVKAKLDMHLELERSPDLALIAVYETRSDTSEGQSVWLLHRRDVFAIDLDEYELDPDAQRLSVYCLAGSKELLQYTSRIADTENCLGLLAEWILIENRRPVLNAPELRVRRAEKEWLFQIQDRHDLAHRP